MGPLCLEGRAENPCQGGAARSPLREAGVEAAAGPPSCSAYHGTQIPSLIPITQSPRSAAQRSARDRGG